MPVSVTLQVSYLRVYLSVDLELSRIHVATKCANYLSECLPCYRWETANRVDKKSTMSYEEIILEMSMKEVQETIINVKGPRRVSKVSAVAVYSRSQQLPKTILPVYPVFSVEPVSL